MGTLGAGRGAGSGGQRSWQRLVGLVQYPICSQFELSEGLPTAREPVVHSFAAHVLASSPSTLRCSRAYRKWAEARQWAGSQASRKKYKMPSSQKPGGTVPGSSKRLASRFYQLKTCHCLTGQHLHWTKNRSTAQCWWWEVVTGSLLQGMPRVESPAEDPVGRGAGGKREGEEPVQRSGPLCRREVQPGGAGLPLQHGCGKAGPG